MLKFTAEIPVCRSGYHWQDADSPFARFRDGDVETRRTLARGAEKSLLDDPQDLASDYYDPFIRAPDLFKNFAKLEPTEDAILAFAKKYGVISRHLPDEVSLLQWRAEIADVANAIELWEAIRANDDDALHRHVRWRRGCLEFCSPLALGEVVRWNDRASEHKPGDLIGPAIELLDFVSQRAKTERLVPRRVAGVLTFLIAVGTLLDVLWVQFAVAVAGDKRYRQCEHCSVEFEMAPGVNRVDRAFCSDSCRVTAYRRRMRLAVELAAAGKPLKEISKKVGSPVEVIKRWLAKGKNDAKKTTRPW